ncbi:MAG: TonB-dependent receptor [Bacteroidales bacterium]|nr:TonB-dependent receptor [Bacteroidales bacterium]
MKKHIIRLVLSAAMICAAALPSGAQSNGKLSCCVSDDVGQLIGAAVRVKGTNNAKMTDSNGKAVLENVPEDAVLEISMIGYVTEEVATGGKDEIFITLREDIQQIEEVVLIGYGTARRKDYAGSVASVRLENSPIALAGNTNALESVKGNVAGLDIGATNSAGGQPSMQIRGQKSISGSNSPLVILDGMIFCGTIVDINPGDIASIEVLKDASSAAAYGSRSANGVLIITTKKGLSAKPVISFNASCGVSGWANKPKLKTGQEYVDMVLARNETTDMSWMSGQEEARYLNGKTTDWLDYATRTGWKQDYQLSVSGAAEKINYYVSASYTDNKGIVKGDDFKRISLLGKLSTDITSWLNFSVDAAYSRVDFSGIAANIQSAYWLSPYGTPERSEGLSLEKYPTTKSDELLNPLWQCDNSMRQNADVTDNYRLNASLLIKCPWVEGLSFRANYALNNTRNISSDFRNERYFVPEGAFDDASRYSQSKYLSMLASATGSKTDSHKKTNVLDFILNYSREFGRHSVDATLVATRDWSTYDTQTITGTDFAANGNTSLGINGLQKATTQSFKQDGTQTNDIGYLARVMYAYDGRYSFQASYRRDGSSVFGANRKWGNFYSVGAAWTPTNEKFYPESAKRVMDRLKVKVSWGKNGNQAIAAYGTLSPVSNGKSGGIRYEFDGSEIYYGTVVKSLGNPDLGWESTSSLNAGFESSWIKGRINLDVDAYWSKTQDQIFTRNIPSMIGYESMKCTMGQVNNWGVEATLRSINIRTRDFQWSSGLTFWINRNKLVHLYGEDLNGDGREDDDKGSNLFIGKSLGAIYGYAQDGIVQKDDVDYIWLYNGRPGTPKYIDVNHDCAITEEDRVILGYTSPNFRLNLSNTFEYKGFELYLMITGTFGGNNRYLRSNPNAFRVNSNPGQPYINSIDINWWTDANPSNVYPIASFSTDGRFLGLQDRTFVRLQDATLSYTFRQPWVRKAGFSTLRLYVSGKNLLTFTNWVGDDPETGSSVMSSTQPVARTFTFGANISF